MSLAALRKHAAALVLVPLTAVAGYFAFFSGNTTITSKELENRERMLLPAWRRDDVSRVTVKRDGASFVLVRARAADGASTWSVEGPEGAQPADEQSADKFLGTVEYATPRRAVPADGVDRARFGLDAPRGSVEIVMGKLTFTIVVGADAPDADGVYVEVPSRGVFVVTKELASGLLPDAGALRSKNFVPYLSTELAALAIRGEGGDKKFVRATWSGGRGSGYLVDDARRARADGNILDQVFVSLGKMSVLSFLEEKDRPAGAPRLTVTLTPKAGDPSTIELYGACPGNDKGVVARRSAPSVLLACVPEAVVPALARQTEDFVDRHVVGASVDEIVELSLARGDKKVEIARSGTGFKMRAPKDGAVPAERGNAYLGDLVALQGRFETKEDEAIKLTGDPVRVVVSSHGGVAAGGGEADRREELVVTTREDGRLRVERKEDGQTLVVEKGDGRLLAVSDVLVRDLVILKEKADAVREVTVVGRGGMTQRFARKGASVDLLEPKGKGLAADADFAVTLFGKLAQLTAVRWVSDEDDGSFGLAEPRFSVTAQLENRKVVIDVGTRTLDGAYARVSDVPGVFVISRDVEEAIDQRFINRMALVLTLEQMTRITITSAAGRKVVLVRDGKAFRVESGGDKLDVSDIIDALDHLVPVSAVAVGAPEKSHGFDKPHLRVVFEGTEKVTLEIGARDAFRGVTGLYARRTDVDAIYLLGQADVRALEDALGEP